MLQNASECYIDIVQNIQKVLKHSVRNMRITQAIESLTKPS